MAMRAPHSCTAAMITGVMMRLGNEKTTVDPGFSPHSSWKYHASAFALRYAVP